MASLSHRLPISTLPRLEEPRAERDAITNALKHAHPTQITLHLSATASLLTLRITDNGNSFDPTAQTHGQPGHFGCIGIRERARKVGAEVKWESAAGKGTTVWVELPLGK